MPTLFYDSARWDDIPPGSAAALYRDGKYAAPIDTPHQLMLKAHRWITIDDDYRNCSIIDWEASNPCFTARGLQRFVLGRSSMDQHAILYFDRADAHLAVEALKSWHSGRLWRYPRLRFWIGTLDGVPYAADDLAEQLTDRWEAPISADQLWADQYLDDGRRDTSQLYRTW